MNTPRRIPSIRMTVPVPVEAHAAFTELAEALGRSVGNVMGEWLLDQAEAARAMAEQIARMRGRGADFTTEVLALTDAVQESTRTVLDRAKKRGAPHAGTAAGGTSGGASKTLTPPSSNTGGKVTKLARKPGKGTQ